MNLIDFLQRNWPELLTLTRQHIQLVLIATATAVAIGVPTGIWLTRKPSWRGPVLGVANVMQTVPSLALFGFLIPLPFVGGIGARPAIIALVLYALLPIIRNTVTGILGVDRGVREAAVAMGMTDSQILRQVELPLAMSVILTGVRVAMVICVGVTTIAAAVGAGGLGQYIFRGLRQNDNNLLLTGAIAAALLALGADFLLSVAEKHFSVTARKNGKAAKRVGIAIVAILILTIGFGYWYEARQGPATSDRQLIVASKDFTESVLLAELLAQMLEERKVSVTRQFELGGNLPHEGLVAGRVDVYPEYTGTAYTAILRHQPITDPIQVYQQVKNEYAERFKLTVSAPLGFENTFAILVRGADARRLGLKTISDAVAPARNWRAGFGQDFMSRADGYAGFSNAYGLKFAQQPSEMDLSLTYLALSSGRVDLIAGNSTEGRIAALDLVQLVDDKRYFPPYEAVYIIRQDSLTRVPELKQILSLLAGAISTEEMRQLNFEVDANKRNPADVVREWRLRRGF